MKLEARCSGCGRVYLVDREAIGAGLPCPECGIPLEAAVPEPSPPPVPSRRQVPNRVATNQAPEIAIDRQPAAEAEAIPVAEPEPEPIPVAVSTAQSTQEPAIETNAVAAPESRPEPQPIPVHASAPPAAEPAAPPSTVPSSEVVCPRCNLHFKPRTEAQERARSSARKTILVVEEMAYFREIVAEALNDHYEVKGVATRDGALSVLSHARVDLMIIDPTVDGGDGGFELLRRIGHKPCPILIYTAQDESEMYGDSWEELRRFGADDIVIKAMNAGEELARKVDALLGMKWEEES